jgi:phytoene dehydrogenase-like protein
MAYGGMSGSAASPRAPGTAFSKFYHAASELGGRFGCWAVVIGGMGAVTQALARSFESYGGEIRLEAPVAQLIHRAGRVAGIVLDNGEEVTADVVLSNADPKTTLLRLAPAEAVDPAIRGKVSALRTTGSGCKINFALSELPRLPALPAARRHRWTMDRAWDGPGMGRRRASPSADRHRSATDPTVAPEGKHVLMLWCHHFRLAGGGRHRHGTRKAVGG